MFVKEQFGPVSVQGAKVPRLFSYKNELDSMDDMKQPGYFNAQRLIIQPDSRINVVAKDFFGTLFVAGVYDGKLCIYKEDQRVKRAGVVGIKIKTPAKKKNSKAA